jgi:hypothetical protein
MRMFTCVTAACTVFLGFSGSRLFDTRSPWDCSKSKGISSYLYTHLDVGQTGWMTGIYYEDRVIVVFGRYVDVSLGCGCSSRFLVLAVGSPFSFWGPSRALYPVGV